jgi:hypothetical protein
MTDGSCSCASAARLIFFFLFSITVVTLQKFIYQKTPPFSKPVFETLVISVGLCLTLIVHLTQSLTQRRRTGGRINIDSEMAPRDTISGGRLVLYSLVPGACRMFGLLFTCVGLVWLPLSAWQIIAAITFFPPRLSLFVQGPSLRHVLAYVILVAAAVVAALSAYEADANAPNSSKKNVAFGAVLTFGGQLILATVTTVEDWFFEDNAPPGLLVLGVQGFVSSVLSVIVLLIVSTGNSFDGNGIHENAKDTIKRLGNWKLIVPVVGLAVAVLVKESIWRCECDRAHALGAVVQIAVVWAVQIVLGKTVSKDGLGEKLSNWSIGELAALVLAAVALLLQGNVIKLPKESRLEGEAVDRTPLMAE